MFNILFFVMGHCCVRYVVSYIYRALCTEEDDDGMSRFSVDPDVSVKSTSIHIELAVLSVELGLSDRQADAVARQVTFL